MRVIKPIQRVIDQLESLPGIGPKTAQRLAYYLLRYPQDKLERFGGSLTRLKLDTKMCRRCHNIDETDPCNVCEDITRDQSLLCVVETPLDMMAVERSGKFKGIYHVLHGLVNPLASIGPDDIFLPSLVKRLKEEDIREVIVATNPSMEGEATAMIFLNRIKDAGLSEKVTVTRIGRGLPTGADLEYADDMTLTQAFEGRRRME